MLFLRRSPTLEVHVPVSPTRTFLNMAHYLTRSLRVRGGRYRDAPIILTVGAEKRDPDLARSSPGAIPCAPKQEGRPAPPLCHRG